MITYDSHVHTAFSTDSDTPMEEMVIQAVTNGLRGITFTDHMDYNFPPTYDKRDEDCTNAPALFTFDLEQYLSQIGHLKEKYRDTIQICYGVELGLKKDAKEKNVRLSRDKRLDYIIGSIHLVDDIDPYYPEYWEAFGEKKGIEKYFEAMWENLQDADSFCPARADADDTRIYIDTLGHLDYIIRYAPSGHRPDAYHMFADIIDEILRLIIARGICLEVNTSGYKNGGSMPNPNENIIRRYRELGGRQITFGSDAHTTELLSGRFKDAEALVRNAGFDHYITFIDHKPAFHTF